MRKSSFLTGKVVTGLVAVFFLASSTTIANATHSWGKYHWARTTNLFTLQLGDNLTTAGDWKTYLREASTQWSTSQVLDTTVGNSSNSSCGPVLGRVEVCNSAYGSNGWLGIASIWATSGFHITQGTVQLNDTYFADEKYNTPSWRRLVMCQEVGHTFGLGHQNERFNNVNLGTCMDYTNAPDGGGSYGLPNLTPNKHDYDQLVKIYSHKDSISTLSAASVPTTGKNKVEKSDKPSSWGQPIGDKDSRGRSSHFELDLGNGEKLFTFVVWADN